MFSLSFAHPLIRYATRLFLLSLSALQLFSPSLHAQQKPKEHAQVHVGIRIVGQGVPTNGLLYFRLYGGGESDRINGAWNGAGSNAATDPGALYALMTPNRHYQATLSADPWSYGEVKFSAPPGYSIWINDRPATTHRVLGNPFLIFKIELRADSDGMLPAGMAQAPHVGDLVWAISAGRYSTGLSAGAVQWRASNLSSDLLNPTSLSYLEPESAETATAWHSDGALLELRTFQFLLYVRRNTTPGTGYDIEIYTPYVTRTGSGNGPYSYDASPYRTYRVSNPNGSTWNNQIKIEKIDSTTEAWTVTQSGANWTVVETNSLRTITRTSTGSAPRIETIEIKDAANAVATKLRRTYQSFGWGQEEMIEETANPDATNGPALTTTYAYHTASGGGYGRLKSVTAPDGSWVAYDYDSSTAGFGNLTTVLRPWQDSTGVTASSATSANCHATLFSYAGERNVFNDLPGGAETKLLGTTVAKNTVSHTYPGNAPNGQPLRTETLTTYTTAGATLTATRQIYNPTTASDDYLGRLYSQTAPDGTKVSALRYKGYWWNYSDNNATNLHKWPGNPGADNTWGEYRFNGFSTQVQDSVPVYSWDGQSFATVYMVPNRSTVELDIFDDQGRVGWRTQYVFTGASGGVPTFEFTSMEAFGFAQGQFTAQTALNGYRDQKWLLGNGWLSGVTRNDGTYTEFTRDALGRDYLVRDWYIDAAGEYPAQGILYTHKTFDIAGRTLTEKVSSSSNAADAGLQTTRIFNVAGLLTSETAPTGLATTYAYANGGRTVTATLPGGATKIVTKWLDGSVKSVTGTAQVAAYQSATVNADGTITRTSTAGPAGASSPRWSQVTTDWAGRTVKEERPAPPNASPSTFTVTFTYNSLGQQTKRTETNLADTLVAYNAWQQPYRTGLDLNANGSLDPSSTDRITETDSVFEKDGNAAWWAKTTTKAYNQDNNATPVTTSVAKTRLNKYDDHGMHFGSYVQSETVAIDIFGNTTKKTVAVQRGSSYFETNLRLVTSTIDYPDSTTDEVSVTRNGLPQKKQSKEGLIYRTYYDGLRRQIKQTDPRTDPNPTPARLGYNSLGQLAWRQDTAGNQTNYTYESATGRLATETDPLGKATRYDYSLRGENIHTWGAATYPVESAFNDYGERVTMKTYRDGTGWDNATWPGTGTADTTTWNFDSATGVLTSKVDAASRTVAYGYSTRGQLKTRQWARGVTTTYNYSATTAEQTGIDYTDSTPDLSYTYNRLGQSATVGDVTGTRTFNYSPTHTQLTQEDLGSFTGTRSVAYQYDSLGRQNLLGVGPTATPTSEYNISYGYETSGRLSQVSTFSYAYAANSNLLASIADSGSSWTQSRTYESNRDLLDVIATNWSTTTKASFNYASDALGRRTAVAKTGEMFTRYSTSGLDTGYGYNDRSEVTAEQTKLGGTSTVLTGRDDAYAFDHIGNRATTTHNGSTATYTANSLNQYSQRTTPGVIDVAGLAPASATVSVNTSTAGITRHGDYYFKNYGVTNTTAVWQSLNIASSFGGATTRFSFVPPTPEPFTYDFDGNLTSDGRWDYTYDAENRLVTMQTKVGAVAPNGPIPQSAARRLEFKNDYLGRRVQKTVRAGYNGSSFTTVLTDTKNLYHGWNLLAEFDASSGSSPPPLLRSFIWGLDWSGTLQGAGGVGGLLNIHDHATATSMRPAYDGNGNLMALLKATDGTLAAAYEYDAFGNTLRATGTYASSNPFRFSTKYTDAETNLVYYGLRYYSPTLGRFINKDPIEEQGGLNLYAFCGNNGINRWDLLGQYVVGDYNSSNIPENYGLDAWGLSQYYKWHMNPPGAGPAAGAESERSRSAGWVSDYRISQRQFAGLQAVAGYAPNNSAPNSGGSGPREGATQQGGNGTDTWTITWHNNGPDGPAWYNEAEFPGENFAPNTAAQDLVVNAQANPYPTNNSGEPIIVVTPGGNALPVPPGGTIQGSPDGRFIDVKGPNGQTTGDQIHGGHKPSTHPDPRGQAPHAHRPGVRNPDGTPWLPVRPEPVPLSAFERWTISVSPQSIQRAQYGAYGTIGVGLIGLTGGLAAPYVAPLLTVGTGTAVLVGAH